MKTIYTSRNYRSILFYFLIIIVISSCNDNDPPLPDNLIAFEADQLGFGSSESSLTVNVNLSRETTAELTIPITVTPTAVVYETDFTTSPVTSGNTLLLTFPKGTRQASFVVTKKSGILLDGDEKISFLLGDVGKSLVLGDKSVATISFAEIIATQGSMDVNVGGQLQPNKVFIDLSANRQTSFNRSDWDLGFYTIDGQFKVILNSSSSMMARALDKSDLTGVTSADTVGWGSQLSTDAVFAAITGSSVPQWAYSSSLWIDDPSGDMNKTALGEVKASSGDNKVFIINRGKNPDGTKRGWKKIRVIRDGVNYTLQHADINATTFTTVQIARNAEYLFNYIKFETGVVDLEPKKDKWDIAFTVFVNTTQGGADLIVPYIFNDVVLQNRYGMETAEIIVSAGGAYEDFDAADLSGVTFSTNQLNIGSKWRSGGGPTSSPALKSDRFYLVKDADGNIYKLKFTALTQNGERGRPQIQFAMVKAG